MPFNKYQRKPKTNAFHIRIGSHIERVDTKDPVFLKMLQQQYATKYLQSLGVQSSQKNINKILKQNPIENCQILQSRLNGGLYTDTITIIPKIIETGQNQNYQKQQVSNQMIQMLDLKRMVPGKYGAGKTISDNTQTNPNNQTNMGNTNFRVKSTINTKTGSNFYLSQNNQPPTQRDGIAFGNNSFNVTNKSSKVINPQNQNQQNSKSLKFLSFDIQDIKSRYIFPFNDNFKRKSNYKLSDNSNTIQVQDPKIVYQSKLFHFPFSVIRLSLKTLKQLQSPIQTKLSQIIQFLQLFYQQFPLSSFPLSPQPQNSLASLNALQSTLLAPPSLQPSIKNQLPLASSSKQSQSQLQQYQQILKSGKSTQKKNHIMSFRKKQIEEMFGVVRSQSMAKMIGVFLHLAYWIVFGAVNPIQIQQNMKKKMYIMMFQTIQYFQIKVENKKLWNTLIFPMILLTLKMSSHYFFIIQYPKIFQNQESIKGGINQLAFDKILYLIQKMFDQSNINGRFIFMQSSITQSKGIFLKDKQFISKRLFGTSPALQIILPNPKNGKTRAIIAKNQQKQTNHLEYQFGKISRIGHFKNYQDDKQCQEKLLFLALHKINNRLQEIHGHGAEVNPIIRI